MSILELFGLGRFGGSPIASVSVDKAHVDATNGGLVLIDVRQPQEWDREGRPKGAHGATLQAADFIEQCESILGGDKTRAIALTCRTGARSMNGANRLARAGFENVVNVRGGLLAWRQNGLPVDTAPF